MKEEEAHLIRSWLKTSDNENEQINLNSWDLANNIAELFDDYILFRPDVIKQWLASPQKKSKSKRNNNQHIIWQEILFNLLHKKINKDPFCIQVEKAIKVLKHGDITKLD